MSFIQSDVLVDGTSHRVQLVEHLKDLECFNDKAPKTSSEYLHIDFLVILTKGDLPKCNSAGLEVSPATAAKLEVSSVSIWFGESLVQNSAKNLVNSQTVVLSHS